MEHDLELFSPILEILEIGVCNIIYNPGNIGKRIFSLSPILEIVDRTIHICSYVDVAGGRGGTAAAAASQQLSHLARPLDHHAQGPNIPFGVNPSLRPTRHRASC